MNEVDSRLDKTDIEGMEDENELSGTEVSADQQSGQEGKAQGPEPIFENFTADEVNGTLLSLPRLQAISVDKLLFARREQRRCKRQLDAKEAELYHELRYGKDRRYTKDDVKVLYARDKDWLELRKELDKADAKVEYYEGRSRALRETGWALRVYVDHQFYLAGEGRVSRVK